MRGEEKVALVREALMRFDASGREEFRWHVLQALRAVRKMQVRVPGAAWAWLYGPLELLMEAVGVGKMKVPGYEAWAVSDPTRHLGFVKEAEVEAAFRKAVAD